MDFWKAVKFWDRVSVIDATIQTTQRIFYEEKRKRPYRDAHAWLALTYGLRPNYNASHFVRFTRTTLYSVLGDNAPLALAYYFLSKEMPQELSNFGSQMQGLIAPALTLVIEQRFFVEWQELNPWTAANVDGMREVVGETVKALARQLANRKEGDLWHGTIDACLNLGT